MTDLQELVAAHGDYNKITPAAWAEYDVAIAKWKIDRILAMGLCPISEEDMKQQKHAKRTSK
jgi:hypothetical protein